MVSRRTTDPTSYDPAAAGRRGSRHGETVMTRKAIWAGAVHGLVVTIAAGGIMIGALPAAAQTVDKAKHMIEDVRDARYCEIIPVVRRGIYFIGTVYNTLGLNDCPP